MDLAEPSVIINTLIQLGMGAAGVLVGGTVAAMQLVGDAHNTV